MEDLGGANVWAGRGAREPGPPLQPLKKSVAVAFVAPVGRQAFERQHLQDTPTQHKELFQSIPSLDDLKAPWLLRLAEAVTPLYQHVSPN